MSYPSLPSYPSSQTVPSGSLYPAAPSVPSQPPSSYSTPYPTSYSASAYPHLHPSFDSPHPSAPDDSMPENYPAVIAYDAGGAEPYGARGTGSGSYWSEPPQSSSYGSYGSDSAARGAGAINSPLIDVQIASVAPAVARAAAAAESVDHSDSGSPGVQSFTVTLLPDAGAPSSGTGTTVQCKIGLDGVRLLEPGSGRVMRIYPLENITCWEVKEAGVFCFWVRTRVDVDHRPVRLRGSAGVVSQLLDSLTAVCMQVFEMVGKDGSAEGRSGSGGGGGGSSIAGASSGDGGKAGVEGGGPAASGGGSLIDWVTAKKATAAVEERVHWVPDSEVPRCAECESEFGTFVRRHHCRNCGNVFCDRCSRGRSPLTSEAGAPAVRVCDACLAEVTQRLTNEKMLQESSSPRSLPSAAPPPPSSSTSATAKKSHEELLQRLQRELERSGSTAPASKPPSHSVRPTPSFSAPPPSSYHGRAGGGGGGGVGGGPAAASSASVPATLVLSCSHCSSISFVSSAASPCPTCGAPPDGPPAHSSTSSASLPSGPPHLWPGSAEARHPAPAPATAAGAVPVGQALPGHYEAAAAAAGQRTQQVACPTCTVHLEVHLPAYGTETIQCGVCNHPFLVGAA